MAVTRDIYYHPTRMHKVASRVCPSVGTKNASSPDPGRSISAKHLQTVQNIEKLPCLCLLGTL